jgi:cysteinyl-tRNA synthetase
MAWKYIGRTLDIHGGGMDLIFPHHESEILQSESLTGRQFAKYWLHNGFVEINKEKMSKSLGNFFTIKDVLDRFEPMVLRFFLVYTHYRSPIDFSDQALEEAKRSYERLVKLRSGLIEITGEPEDGIIPDLGQPDDDILKRVFSFKKEFQEAMDDDFNTRIAVAVLFKIDTNVKQLKNDDRLKPNNAYPILSILDELTDILGIVLKTEKGEDIDHEILDRIIRILIDLRNEARENKDWSKADSIRDRLRDAGIVLEDSENTIWKFKEN